MADAKAFTGIALSDSDGGSVLVRINIESEQAEQEWPEAVEYDQMSEDEIVADAEADVATSDEDPASAEADDEAEYVSETFDEEEE